MSDWQEIELGQLAEFRNGVNFSQDDEGSGIPILKVKDFGDLHFAPVDGLDELDTSKVRIPENQFLSPGDIVIVRSNGNRELVGRSMIYGGAPNSVTFSGFCIRARVDSKIATPSFIHYWLRSPLTRQTFSREGNGTGINNLSQGFLGKQKIKLPALAEQDAIAATLSALDDKIELNRRMNETLEALAQAVFKDWFVTFGPTSRKMEGATDPVAILGGLIPDPTKAAPLVALFPGSFGADGLPVGWEEREIGQDFHVTMGQSPPGDTYNESGNGLPFYQGRRDFGWRFPTRRVYCSAPTRVSPADWTLVSVRAPVGDINRAWEECCIGRGVGAFMHRDKLASFTHYAGLHLREELASYDKDGTVFGSINQNQFKALKICGADQTAATAFDDFVSPIDALIRTKTDENRTLAETRDYLLPKLMSGAVRVRDAEAMVEGADA